MSDGCSSRERRRALADRAGPPLRTAPGDLSPWSRRPSGAGRQATEDCTRQLSAGAATVGDENGSPSPVEEQHHGPEHQKDGQGGQEHPPFAP